MARHLGLGLAEVIIATSLLLFVFLAIMEIVPSASLATHLSSEELQADMMANSALERARMERFDIYDIGYQPLPSVVVGPVTYSQVLDVYPVPGEDPKVLKGLRVTVTWKIHQTMHSRSQEAYLVAIHR